MVKRILKWTGITVVSFFGVIIVVAIFAADSVFKPTEAIDQPVEQLPITEATSAPAETQGVAGSVSITPESSTSLVPYPTKASNQTTTPAPTSRYTYYAVIKVVDGDTITINIDGTDETIRLIGINTPETVDPRKPVECFGKQASDEAKTLLTGRKVRIEKDPTQGDRYEYTYQWPHKYQAQFKADQAIAESQNRGLWSPSNCDGSASIPPSTTVTRAATSRSGHTFYLSTYYTSKYYYCDTDDAWKSLSTTYLKSYPSEQALLAAYPSRTKHQACK